jgi:hypothetical protein
MSDIQDTPIEAGHDAATDTQRLAGILAQVRADLQLGHSNDARDLLTQRLHDAAIELSEADFDAALASLA